jgi:hypothetical protein
MKQTAVEWLEKEYNDKGKLTPLPPSSFIFCLKQDEPPIIIIDEKGFQYKGELIEDAGEVYKLFKEFLQKNKI